MPESDNGVGILKKVFGIFNSMKRAEIFLNSGDKMQLDNYYRALSEELELLGDEKLDQARSNAQKRESEGYQVALKRHNIAVGFNNESKE